MTLACPNCGFTDTNLRVGYCRCPQCCHEWYQVREKAALLAALQAGKDEKIIRLPPGQPLWVIGRPETTPPPTKLIQCSRCWRNLEATAQVDECICLRCKLIEAEERTDAYVEQWERKMKAAIGNKTQTYAEA